MKKIFLATLLSISIQCFSADVEVNQKDKNFIDGKGKQLKTIDVKLGDKLIFKNSEASITHNVYSLSPGNSFELKTQKLGKKTELVLSPKK